MSGPYRTIVADPPWEYGSFVRGPSAHGRSSRHALPYPSMTVAAMADLPVCALAEKSAHLWLWTTNRYLHDAFHLVDAWGFRFKQVLVWHKTGCPTPFSASFAPNHAEFLLFSSRGTAPLVATLPSNIVGAPQQRIHSRKPDVFLDLVEQVSPGPYLEMFSRRARFGWDTWGDEALHGTEATS